MQKQRSEAPVYDSHDEHGDSQSSPGLSSPPGLSRRPRAGTMPSIVPLTSALLRPDVLTRRLSGLSLGPSTFASVPSSGATTPILGSDMHVRNPSSLNPMELGIPLRMASERSRLRSGSLTLPAAGLSSAFGQGVFGSSWAPPSMGARIPEEIRSIHSTESSVYGDESHVRTLDYLGLDDNSSQTQGEYPSGFGSPPSGHGGGGRDDLYNHVSPGRLRANTVAGLPRRSPPFRIPAMTYQTGLEEEDESEVGTVYTSTKSHFMHPDQNENDDARLLYSTGQLNLSVPAATGSASLRPRASTIGILDEASNGFLRRRNGPTSTLSTTPPITHQDNLVDQAYLVAPSLNSQPSYVGISEDNPASRTASPDRRGQSPPPQQPSRSLWIGNLDSKTTAQELMQIFAVYGAIESLRLLPEKECAFINFASVHDSIHAKEDIMNRLGGQLPVRSSGHIRIGFGKADSAPALQGSLFSKPSANILASPDNHLQTSPTRALWIGSIPAHTSPADLLRIFSPYGPIESARVLTHKNCGFVNFERLDDSISARKALNGRELLGSEHGSIKIGFAKVPVKTNAPGNQALGKPGADPFLTSQEVTHGTNSNVLSAIRNSPMDQQFSGANLDNYRSNLITSFIGPDTPGYGFGSAAGVPNVSKPQAGDRQIDDPSESEIVSIPMPAATDLQILMRELSGSEVESPEDIDGLAEYRPPRMYYTSIPAVQSDEREHSKRYATSDPSRIREIKKRLETGISQIEADGIGLDLLEDSVGLSSDYIGNVIIQRLFEQCSDRIKIMLLERIAPHLASIGCHKNGTWAAQKIIERASTPEEVELICRNLKPYTPALLLGGFSNYVVQGTLRFGSPASSFVFDAMVDRCWEIGQGRFGARSMRTCLEHPLTRRVEHKRVAIAIVLNSIPLATNPNGSLLLAWLLDTSGLPGRYRLLAPRFAPHLSHLCTHKLASMSVLRIINQKADPGAAKLILEALFDGPPQVLEDVLGDQVHGAAVIQKILASPFIDPVEKHRLGSKVQSLLINLRLHPVPAYRKLLDALNDLGIAFGTMGSGPLRSTFPPAPSHLAGPSWQGQEKNGMQAVSSVIPMSVPTPQAGMSTNAPIYPQIIPPMLPMSSSPFNLPSAFVPTTLHDSTYGYGPRQYRDGSQASPGLHSQLATGSNQYWAQ